MSGPKIVRIVTPEERRIIKQKWLSRLQSKIAGIKEYALANDALSENLKESLEETLKYYQSISEDEYSKIEEEVPNQLRFLEEEKKNLVKKVVEKRSSQWDRYKSLKSRHNEIRSLLINKNIEFEDCEEPSVVSEEKLKNYSEKIEGLYKTLKDAVFSSPELTDYQIEIQRRLSTGNSLLSVEEWSSNQPKVISRLKKLEGTLKEMHVNGLSQEKIKEFIQRCNLLDEKDSKYLLLLDSLIIEVANFTKDQLELEKVKEALNDAIIQLEGLGIELKFIGKWKDQLKSDNLTQLQETLDKANRLYDEESQRIISEAKREAVKRALIKTGYKVNDSMKTAWVENGRLVVKKAKNSLYGVEFMNPKDMSRIQARVVADENRKNERSFELDKNQEEIWCDELDVIKEVLASEDLSIIIEKMQKPGAVKLKEVILDESYQKSHRTVKKSKGL